MNTSDVSFHVAKALLQSAETERDQETEGAPQCLTVTISRQVGAMGNTVAREVGRLLCWPAYDQEILDRIAQELQRPSFMLRSLDERSPKWLDTAVAGMADDYHVSPSAYLKYLIGVVRGLGRIGNCVLVGRGAGHILPPASTLRVRLVGSAEDRAVVVSQRTGLGAQEATRWMEQTERARLEFVKKSFGVDAADAANYDLVLNTSRVPVSECARIIVEVVREFEARSGSQRAEPVGAGV